MKNAVLAVAVAATLSGCISMPAPMERPPFPVAEYAQLDGRTGTGVVTGQVFLRTRGGEVRYGAGSEVLLNPVTSYSTHWYTTSYQGNKLLADPDPRYNAHIITVQADGSGNFRFESVPAGDYYLTSEVFWDVPGPYGVSNMQGGYISERVSVEDGKEVRQMLTR